jgi:hypothetical protein
MIRRLGSWLVSAWCLASLLALAEVGLRIADVRRSQQPTAVLKAVPEAPAPVTYWQLVPGQYSVGRIPRPTPRSAKTTGSSRSETTAGRDLPKPAGDDSLARFVVNSTGCRGDEFEIPKPAGTFRVVCLGNESWLGLGLDETEPAPAVLQSQLNAALASVSADHGPRTGATGWTVEAVNAGQPDGCPLTHWLRARQNWPAWQPDLCLVAVQLSDWGNAYQIRRHVVTDQKGTPVACPHPSLRPTAPGTLLDDCRSNFKTVDWLWQQGARWNRQTATRPVATALRELWTDEGPLSDEFQREAEPLIWMHNWAGRCGSRLIVVLMPDPWECSASASPGGTVRQNAGLRQNEFVPNVAAKRWLLEQLTRAGITVCDLSVTFPQDSSVDALYLDDQRGWTSAGHRHIANSLARFLWQETPGPWRMPNPTAVGTIQPAVNHQVAPRSTGRRD